MLVDHEIRKLLCTKEPENNEETAILGGKESQISAIGYDLIAKSFYENTASYQERTLASGESVFVESEEVVRFGLHIVGRVVLRNSRIRMGLTLESPLYQPGHKTRIYFRLTNISRDAIKLKAGESYASLHFETLEDTPEKAYNGNFQDEFRFKDLGNYSSKYAEQIQSIGGKLDTLKDMEKSIYGNVSTILTIFVAIFTLLNVNISLAQGQNAAEMYLLFNLSTVGAISALALLLAGVLDTRKKVHISLWIIPAICFIAIFLIFFF